MNDYTCAIFELFNTFFDKQSIDSTNDVKVENAFNVMTKSYNPRFYCDDLESVNVLDYNNIHNQYAYLHKYAMLHTILACDILQKIFQDRYVFLDIESKTQLSLCSLGGGPGTDIIALLFVVKEMFGITDCKINVIDLAYGWKSVFERLILKMITSFCDKTRPLPSWTTNYEYSRADLLLLPEGIPPDVYYAITNADILTMVKFISAVDSRKAREMVKVIFYIMKQDSFLLFIDNAAGGFHEMMAEVAEEYRDCGITSAFGPLKNYVYSKPILSRRLHKYDSLSMTTVTVQLWKKTKPTHHLLHIIPTGAMFHSQD